LAAFTAASPIAARGGLVHAGRRRFLDHLLVAALQRAVALEQMHSIAVRVAEHLHLDMAGAVTYFSSSTRSSPNAEAASRLAAVQRGGEVLGANRPGACPCRRRRPPP
jgi:hypothetical protein